MKIGTVAGTNDSTTTIATNDMVQEHVTNFHILPHIIYREEYIVNILSYDIHLMFDGKIIIFCTNHSASKHNMKFLIS